MVELYAHSLADLKKLSVSTARLVLGLCLPSCGGGVFIDAGDVTVRPDSRVWGIRTSGAISINVMCVVGGFSTGGTDGYWFRLWKLFSAEYFIYYLKKPTD